MARNKKHLTAALLSSALFAAFLPLNASAFAILSTADNNSDSTARPAGTGYLFAEDNINFRVLDGVAVGNTGGISIGNQSPATALPNSNVTLQFVGSSVVSGIVGSLNNPMDLIEINTGYSAGEVVEIGQNIFANEIRLFDDGSGNGSTLKIGGSTINTLITTAANNTNMIMTTGAGQMTFNKAIGAADKQLNLITIDRNAIFLDKVYASNITLSDEIYVTGNGEIFAPVYAQANGVGKLVYDPTVTTTIHQQLGDFGKHLQSVRTWGFDKVTNVDATIYADLLSAEAGSILNFRLNTSYNAPTDINTGATLAVEHGFTANNEQNIIFTNAENTKLRFDMNNDLTYVGVMRSDSQIILNDATITVLNPGFSPGQTTKFQVIESKMGGLPASAPVVTNSFLTTITATGTANEMFLNVTSTPLASISSGPQTQGVAGALDSLALLMLQSESPNPIRAILGQLNYFADANAINDALKTLAPVVDGAMFYEGINMQQTFFGEISDRMASVDFFKRHVKNASGVGSGDWQWTQESTWMKLVGQTAKQKERNQVAGYDNDMMGIILGGDFNVDNNLTLGGALGWLTSRVNDRVWDGTKTDIHSIQGSLYAGYDCDGPWFFNNLIGFAYNDYNQYREIQFGTAHFSASSDFDGWQIAGKSEVGYFISSPQFKDAYVVPNASIYYSHVIMSGYDEKGASTASQSINRENYDALIATVGVKAMRDFVDQVTLIQPEVHFNVYYDFVGDRVETTSQFSGLGPSFKTVGYDPARLGVNVGAALSVYTQKGFTFTAEYDFDAKADYIANAGMLRGRYIWG